jgi:hypothetical protein
MISPLKPWPYNHIRNPRPADWGIGMTVCIAVACDEHTSTPKLLMVPDTHLTIGVTSADVLKARSLAKTWSTMMAGDDVTYAEDVVSGARTILESKPSHELKDVALAMAKAYQAVRRSQIEEQHLSSYDLDMASFLAKGPDFPTPAKRQSILDRQKVASGTKGRNVKENSN